MRRASASRPHTRRSSARSSRERDRQTRALITPERLPGVVRRNTFVLAAGLALAWAVIQLTMSVAAITMESLAGDSTSAGLAPAVFLLAFGLANLPAGRFMDARGRVPGLSAGFALAGLGALGVFAMVGVGSIPGYLLALALLGAGLGVVNLSRVAAADMYPPERRGAGVGLVLAGAAVGAILGPLVFGPLLAGDDPLVATWLAAAALAFLGAAGVWLMSVDPLRIARERGNALSAAGRRSLRAIFATERARAAAIAIVATQVVMSTLMSLGGLELHHRGHDLTEISGALAAHFFGMFALAPVIGRVVDQVGRRSSLLIGVALLASSAAALPLAPGVAGVAIALFGLGVGWNIAFVGGTALLADATAPHERAGALGAIDLINAAASSSAAALGAALLGAAGLGAVVIVGLAALAPPILFLVRGQRASGRPA